MNYTRYLRGTIAWVVVASLATAAINVAVDPLWCFGWDGPWNDNQLAINERQQKTDLLRFRGTDADTLILGSSRVTVLDPRDFVGVHAFNDAVSGCMPDEFLPNARFARDVSGHGFATIVVGLDFFGASTGAFADRPPPTKFIDESGQLMYRVGIALNLETLRFSLKNILLTMRLRRGEAPDQRYYRQRTQLVQPPVPEGKNAYDWVLNLGIYRQRYGKDFAYDPRHVEHLRGLKQAFPESRFVVFTNPEHQDLFQLIVAHGLVPSYKRWLTEAVDVFGAVYDFGGVNSVTARTGNFVDPSHYRHHVGRWMVHRMAGQPDDAPTDFGVLVTSTSLESHLRLIDSLAADAARNP